MFATKFMSALLTVTPALMLLGSVSSAQMTPTLQATTLNSKQLEAEFTPPQDSDPGDNFISTSTGTHFKPPRDVRPLSGPVTPGGSRQGSCLGFSETAFTAFGPRDTEFVVGQTVSTHPTFVWYLPESDTTFNIIFRLLAPNEADIPVAIFEETLSYTPGFVNYQLPETEDPLSSGVNYRWQVIIECNPAYPSRALVQELPFEVVTPTAALSQSLSAATTDAERAVAYGQAGIWYDAIAQVAQATSTADQQTRGGLLSDLVDSIEGPGAEQLRQDVLAIVNATTPTSAP